MQNPKSVDDQFRECRKYVIQQGWDVVAEFSDSGVSGALRDRPGYAGLLAAVSAKQCDVVLFEHIDRLGRDIERAIHFFKAATHAKVDLHQLGRGKFGVFDIGILSTFSALFLEELGVKTRRGLAGKVAAGGSGGGLSYGYRVPTDGQGNVITGELVIAPEQAEIIRRIFREYATGRSPMHIAAELNMTGIPAPRGRGTNKAATPIRISRGLTPILRPAIRSAPIAPADAASVGVAITRFQTRRPDCSWLS